MSILFICFHQIIQCYSLIVLDLPVVIGFLFADAEVSEYGVEHLLSGDGVTRYFA